MTQRGLSSNPLLYSEDKYFSDSESLFHAWKNKPANNDINHKDSVFVYDGIVAPKIWLSQNIRPLFLLREAYGGDSDWSLCDYLASEGVAGLTWKRVSQWTKGIFCSDNNIIFPFNRDKDVTVLGNEWLKKISVINIKKSDGKNKSNCEEILKYAQYDKNELLKQIEICNPTVIICGNTFDSLKIIMGDNIKPVDRDNWQHVCSINDHQVGIINFYHPANQFPDLLNYYGLMSIYKGLIMV